MMHSLKPTRQGPLDAFCCALSPPSSSSAWNSPSSFHSNRTTITTPSIFPQSSPSSLRTSRTQTGRSCSSLSSRPWRSWGERPYFPGAETAACARTHAHTAAEIEIELAQQEPGKQVTSGWGGVHRQRGETEKKEPDET